MDQLDEELPNLRIAVDWLLEHGEAKRALRLLVATEDFWTQRLVSYAELHRWLEAALAAAPDAPARDRVLGHWLLSTGNGAQGNHEAALFHAQQVLKAAEESGDSASLGFAHMALAYAWEDRGEIAQAAAAYAATIPVWWDAGAWYPKAQLADKLVLQGNLEVGVPMLEEALARLRQANPHWSDRARDHPARSRRTATWRLGARGESVRGRYRAREGSPPYAGAPGCHGRVGGGGTGMRPGGASSAVTRRGRRRARIRRN